MKHEATRQGRIAGWLRRNDSSIVALAAHCGKSKATMSRHCNAKEVPTDILTAMSSFKTDRGKTIPVKFLPKGKDKKPGPRKGWLERKLEEARRAAFAQAAS